jgi:exosome complex component RRP42
MAPSQAVQVNLSPAELSFLRSTLSQTPPIRLDSTKGPKDFRSMRAEYDVLPSANGSARIALEDGTEALVGVKAEVEKSQWRPSPGEQSNVAIIEDMDGDDDDSKGKGQNAWVEMSVEIPGFREDDSLPVFLASMLTESLLASGELKDRLDVSTPVTLASIDADNTLDSAALPPTIVSSRASVHGYPPRPPYV